MYTPPVIDYLQYVDINNGNATNIATLTTSLQNNTAAIASLNTGLQDINDRTRYIHCTPNVGCIVYNTATNQSVNMYGKKFYQNY